MGRILPRAWLAVLVGVLAIAAHTASSYTLAILMKSITADFGWDRTTFRNQARTFRWCCSVLAEAFDQAERSTSRAISGGIPIRIG